MSKSSIPPEHDREARARIRNKLLHYMREHGIGAPELTARIYAAEKTERKVTLGISTVQRFLANKVRTVESYVDMFERFTKDFPSPDPLLEVGKSMAALYGKSGGRDFSGVFYATMQTGEDSEVTVSQEPGFWRVKEITRSGGHSVFDGVAVCSREGAFFVLKDKLAGLPRTYTVWPQENDELHGCGTTIRLVSFDPRIAMAPYIRSFEIKLRK
jgi:hypothetical protein